MSPRPEGAVLPEAPARGAFHPLTVSAVERLCEDAVAVTFAIPDELRERFAFRPGQHLTVRRPGAEERRSYSICAAAGEAPRIGVRRVPGGDFSGWLVDEVRPGDVVEVQAPQGRFTPDTTAGGRHVLVAAGSGVTPLLSIAASMLAASEAQVTLLYGNRRADTTMFLEELADLKDAYPSRFELVHVLSREPRDVELFTGRLDGARLAAILTALVPVGSVDGFWLCGPFVMVEEHRAALAELGVPADRVHAELFHVDAPPPVLRRPDAEHRGAAALTFTLDGRTARVPADRGRTLLEAAQASRTDVPFACRGGVCGTCRARVVSGEVEMTRNFALEPHEVEAGFVLTCQTHPVSDTVEVDFDA